MMMIIIIIIIIVIITTIMITIINPLPILRCTDNIILTK